MVYDIDKKGKDKTKNIDKKQEDETKKRVKSNIFYSTNFSFYKYCDIKKLFDHSFSLNRKDLNRFKTLFYKKKWRNLAD